MPESDDDELRLVLQRLARRIRINRAVGDLGDSQLSVLFHLDRLGPQTPGDLAILERVTPPSMNRTVNGLEEGGHVVRAKSVDDARKVLVDLTPSAHDLLVDVRAQRTAWFSQHLAALEASERSRLDAVIPILRKLADS
ncbi:MAG: MarR family transcriptional regulator [Pseudolysinimonas sp.]|uniref:MarR family winged helix-turn-helix transcriptional regulator n=1 Tax=Pseudolysinimonas sp. TaxID=2680009 RepID=UPI00326402F6